jgi:hypothetical protein
MNNLDVSRTFFNSWNALAEYLKNSLQGPVYTLISFSRRKASCWFGAC